jgi:hypothetical protein
MDASYGLVNSRPRREGYLVGGKAAGLAFTNRPARQRRAPRTNKNIKNHPGPWGGVMNVAPGKSGSEGIERRKENVRMKSDSGNLVGENPTPPKFSQQAGSEFCWALG